MKRDERLNPPLQLGEDLVELELRGAIDRRRPPRWIEILVDILDSAPTPGDRPRP